MYFLFGGTMKKLDLKENKNVIIHPLENLQVAFNEKDFLIIINSKEECPEEGYFLSIPADIMAEIVNGFHQSGLEYQKTFSMDIGFVEKEA